MNSQKKILIIEDNKFFAQICKNGLKRNNFEVVLAVNGEEGIKLAKSENIDLIVSDLVMPEKDGFEVLKKIKEDKKTKKIPIIILSSLGQKSDIKKTKELGAIDYFVKSDLKIKELVNKINLYLSKK